MTRKEEVLGAIAKEIKLTAGPEPSLIDTIYFGGGTPSLLSPTEITALLEAIGSVYTVHSHAEITLEANPDDISEATLEGWKATGVNRLSIGVQSFFEEDLIWMHRAHNALQAKQALEQALRHFPNITIDLIYGTPGLSNTRWRANVEQAIALQIPHLSCYALTVEPRTPLEKLIRTHKKEPVQPEVQSEQFLLLMDWLDAAGYEHYEISNFAKPGFRSRHNTAYWKGRPYIGIGPSAHSFNATERRWNIANNQQYLDAIASNELPAEKEVLTPIQQLNETIMISLRTIEGVDLKGFEEHQRQALLAVAQKYIDRNLLFKEGTRLRLTNEGKLFADGIAADLFLE